MIWAPSATGWRRSSKLKRIKSKELKNLTHIYRIVEKKTGKSGDVILYQIQGQEDLIYLEIYIFSHIYLA